MNTNTPESELEPRFRRSNVERFVPYIKRALTMTETRISPRILPPRGLNNRVAEARLADAVHILKEGYYPDYGVDQEELKSKWHLLTKEWDTIDQQIIIKPKDGATNDVGAPILDLIFNSFDPGFKESLLGCAAMHHWKHLRGSIKVIGVFEPSLRLELEQSYNASIKELTSTEHVIHFLGAPRSDTSSFIYEILPP